MSEDKYKRSQTWLQLGECFPEEEEEGEVSREKGPFVLRNGDIIQCGTQTIQVIINLEEKGEQEKKMSAW